MTTLGKRQREQDRRNKQEEKRQRLALRKQQKDLKGTNGTAQAEEQQQ